MLSDQRAEPGVRPSPIFFAIVALTAVAAWFTTQDGGARLAVFVFVAGAWTLSLIFHEFAHALVARRFEVIRREVLGRRREPAALREEVREMRERMREALSKGKSGHFDIKQDPGGIADIEFMVQYGVLAWACDHPGLLTYTDNIRLLAGLAENGLLPPEDVDLLSETYRAFRARVHRLALQEQFAVVPEEEFAAQREGVLRIWQTLMEDPA